VNKKDLTTRAKSGSRIGAKWKEWGFFSGMFSTLRYSPNRPFSSPHDGEASGVLRDLLFLFVSKQYTLEINRMTGVLDYLQLLSGPDQVQVTLHTSYPTYIIALCHHVATRLQEFDGLLPLVSVR